MTIYLLGPQGQAISLPVWVGRGFPHKERDVLSAFQSQESWLALGVCERGKPNPPLYSMLVVPKLPTHKTTFENILSAYSSVHFPSWLSPKILTPLEQDLQIGDMKLGLVVLHPATLWNY